MPQPEKYTKLEIALLMMPEWVQDLVAKIINWMIINAHRQALDEEVREDLARRE